ncbi:MAG: Glu-tRNA(Gln) amidotransferase subunit GatD [Candidatus Anstonellales archaeon]
MYSESVRELLSKKGIEEGDKIKVVRDDLTFEGMLLPKIGFGDPSCIVLKLDNGYNIGIDINTISDISLLSKGRIQKEDEVITVPSTLQIPKKRISVLACGGTIASKVEYETGAVKPSVSAEEIVSEFHELHSLASFDTKQIFNILSEDMTPQHWSIMAKEVYDVIKSGTEGVVIAHGTDTMGYSAAALSFMLQDPPIPIVLTGSQRSTDRGSSDNKINLICSVLCAKSDIAHVGVCMHATSSDDFCYFHLGTRVRKMHTSRRDAFQTIGGEPLAIIDYLKKSVSPLTSYRKRDEGRQLKFDNRLNPNVALIYAHPGIKPEFISSLSKYDGVVIAATGLGHVSTNYLGDGFTPPIIDSIKELCTSGIPIVIAPQTIFGRIDMNVYANGRRLLETGVIGNGCDMIPETALVKLMWVLGHEKDPKRIKEEMERNIAGEITERSSLI